jgi:hypothetical protein
VLLTRPRNPYPLSRVRSPPATQIKRKHTKGKCAKGAKKGGKKYRGKATNCREAGIKRGREFLRQSRKGKIKNIEKIIEKNKKYLPQSGKEKGGKKMAALPPQKICFDLLILY